MPRHVQNRGGTTSLFRTCPAKARDKVVVKNQVRLRIYIPCYLTKIFNDALYKYPISRINIQEPSRYHTGVINYRWRLRGGGVHEPHHQRVVRLSENNIQGAITIQIGYRV